MAEVVVDKVEQPSYLEMSDEDMLNAAPPVAVVAEKPAGEVAVDQEPVKQPVAGATVDDEDDEVVDGDDADDKAKPAKGSEAADADAGTAAKEAGEEAGVKPPEKDLKPGEKAEVKDPADKPKEVAEAGKETPVVVDFEAEYKRMLAPFKANGREVAVKSVDDAISLMQMGANYNKKMAALKPSLKLMKMLENSGLLSEEKIGYLIDLDKKDPQAINKLVKESGINPMDLDAEKAGEYKPKIHTVDDREIDLDTVLDEIKDTPTYTRTLAIVSKEWDGASKQTIAGQPQLLKVINDHIERGIYDLISQEVESEKMLGRLSGLSDLEAYSKVGDAIQARGGFSHLGSPQGKTNTAPVVVPPKPKKDVDDALNEKRRAASSTKPAAPSAAAAKDFNPLALSDEEFSKLSADKFR